MNIYFGASVSLDRSQLPRYRQIVDEVKKLGHTVLSEYVVDPKLVVGDHLEPDELFARETTTVAKADLMIAEISSPSWGTAFLMEHALKSGVPVLALFYKDAHQPIPMMIEGHPDFYLEHYSEDNLYAMLQRNLNYFDTRQHLKGKLIVIDGADGSGKATQTQLLLDYLKEHRFKSRYISFPRYTTSFHGQHVGRFLTGEFGGNNDVSPYLSSLAFALDRLTAKDEMVDWLKRGKVVVADRYVSANMAHQTAKLPPDKRQAFIDWIYEMEYKQHKLPKEDIVIFLHVPAEVSQKLLAKSADAKGIKKGKDEAEKDIEHQKKSIAMYQELAKQFKHWEIIDCVDTKGNLLSREAIHDKVVAVLKKRGIV